MTKRSHWSSSLDKDVVRTSGEEGRHISPRGEERGVTPQLFTGQPSWHRSSACARAKPRAAAFIRMLLGTVKHRDKLFSKDRS